MRYYLRKKGQNFYINKEKNINNNKNNITTQKNLMFMKIKKKVQRKMWIFTQEKDDVDFFVSIK